MTGRLGRPGGEAGFHCFQVRAVSIVLPGYISHGQYPWESSSVGVGVLKTLRFCAVVAIKPTSAFFCGPE